MKKSKRITFALAAACLLSLLFGAPALSAETEAAKTEDYIHLSSYTEIMRPADETDGILEVSCEGKSGEDGYLYLFESVAGMQPQGEAKGSNLTGSLEKVSIGAVNYFRIKAADKDAAVTAEVRFLCEDFYNPEMKAEANGRKNYPIDYKFKNYLDSGIDAYALHIYLPEEHEVVKVSKPSAYEDYILGEEDNMRSVGLETEVKASGEAELKFTFNKEDSGFKTAVIWILCMGVGLAVLIDRVKKDREQDEHDKSEK